MIYWGGKLTVAEFITMLQQLPQDHEVYIYDEEYGHYYTPKVTTEQHATKIITCISSNDSDEIER